MTIGGGKIWFLPSVMKWDWKQTIAAINLLHVSFFPERISVNLGETTRELLTQTLFGSIRFSVILQWSSKSVSSSSDETAGVIGEVFSFFSFSCFSSIFLRVWRVFSISFRMSFFFWWRIFWVGWVFPHSRFLLFSLPFFLGFWVLLWGWVFLGFLLGDPFVDDQTRRRWVPLGNSWFSPVIFLIRRRISGSPPAIFLVQKVTGGRGSRGLRSRQGNSLNS